MSRVRALGLLVAVPATLGLLGPPASAEPPQVEDAQLVVVLDASASMLEPEEFWDAPRIDAVRAAVNGAIAGLDPDDQVGLRVFGATLSGAEAPGACDDSQLVVPIGGDNRDALTTGVEEYAPVGAAPIGYALEEASNDLGPDGQRSILLISDGESSCDPDPCAAARELAAQDINLTINVVGLNYDAAPREQLRCIADAGHGTYFDAQDGGTLAAATDRLVARAFRPFAVTGTPVEGTPTPEGAPELTPGGQYTDFVGALDEPRHYLIRRNLAGSSIHVGFTALMGEVPKRTDDALGWVSLELLSLDGDSCLGTGGAFGLEGPWALVVTQVSYYADPDDLASACLDDDVLVLSVTMTDWVDEIIGVPFELVISEEPRLAPNAVLQDAAESGQVQWQPMSADGAGGAVLGGSSLNDAPVTTPGSYTSDILPGETMVVRVPLEWGQWLQAQADFGEPSPDVSAVIDSGLEVYLTVISPNRGDATEWSMVGTETTNWDWLHPGRPTHVASATLPVRWWNRGDSITDGASVPGDYYVAISVAEDDAGESFVIPFTLTLGVFGTAGQGAPPYDTTTGTASSSETALTDEPTSPTEDSLATAQANTANGGRADDEGMAPLVIGAFGVAGIALVGRGAYLLRRNARAPR